MIPKLLLASIFLSGSAFANCVNPGGSCNGSVPCCDPYNNACFRGRCVRVNNLTEQRDVLSALLTFEPLAKDEKQLSKACL